LRGAKPRSFGPSAQSIGVSKTVSESCEVVRKNSDELKSILLEGDSALHPKETQKVSGHLKDESEQDVKFPKNSATPCLSCWKHPDHLLNKRDVPPVCPG